MSALNTKYLATQFQKGKFENEDDIKLKFYSQLARPILEQVSPDHVDAFRSEPKIIRAGRADALFQEIVFEYKKFAYFDKVSGCEEALYGRGGIKNQYDCGLYHYIIGHASLLDSDKEEILVHKLQKPIGVGFDGKTFLFARFRPSSQKKTIVIFKKEIDLPLEFYWEAVKDLKSGLDRLMLLFRQRNKRALTKVNLLSAINPCSKTVRANIQSIYSTLCAELNSEDKNPRIITLYKEWNRVFGTLYGEESEQTDFTEYASELKAAYGIVSGEEIDLKIYLFALQTYFNILIKLMISTFLRDIMNPLSDIYALSDRSQITRLFEGMNKEQQALISNFFEIHFYEWFTYSEKFDIAVIQSTLDIILQFEMASYWLKPESMQDILQEIYMELIPAKLRHLMGEYFTPDWAVELVLDKVEFKGDSNQRLCDPTCGSGSFLLHAISKTLSLKSNISTVKTIIKNIIGFDINPISAVAAKANYILALLSPFYEDIAEKLSEPLHIHVYISDSVLSPIVYSEQNKDTLIAKTHAGNFEIPKFGDLMSAFRFLEILSLCIEKTEEFEKFKIRLTNEGLFEERFTEIYNVLYEKIFSLHRAGKDAFWPKILKNNFAPIMISRKFDFVVGNPPWIAWKAMSKSYRLGTVDVWKSYGIFEKNAYDKKTTHDDFAMAVTYVAIDYYLKKDGKLGFLLPASFLKSTKGGHGFRKLCISRKEQDIPFAVTRVDDFSKIKLFTINSMAFFAQKGKKMRYPFEDYYIWEYATSIKKRFEPHLKLESVLPLLRSVSYNAQPISAYDEQSAWSTLPHLSDILLPIVKKLLISNAPRYYRGRKGIEPAGAKGVFVVSKPEAQKNGDLMIATDFRRQRRQDFLLRGEHKGLVEATHIYPMLGGRNIARWRIKSNEYILVPHSSVFKYGIPETTLLKESPKTYEWLSFYEKELLASRIQNGKFFNEEKDPFYRLDNVGSYTFSPYKVCWKEQTGSMSAVVVGNSAESLPSEVGYIFPIPKSILVDSKVLFLSLKCEKEAHYICGILNSPLVRKIIDSYAISTNRGVDVLKYLAIPKFSITDKFHILIASISRDIHEIYKHDSSENREKIIKQKEQQLEEAVIKLFS